MFENISETGKIFGMQILQPKAVRTESKKWFKENHPRFWVFECAIWLVMSFGAVGWYKNSNGMMPLITIGSFLVYILVLRKYYNQYDKQAPEELRQR